LKANKTTFKLGHKVSEETRRRIGLKSIGRIPWNKGKHLPDWVKAKLVNSHKGKKLTEEHKKKLKIAATGRVHTESSKLKMSLCNRGRDNWNWKGGVTAIKTGRFGDLQWNKRRKECYKRDGHRCKICGIFNVRLEAHHIIPWRISHNDDLTNLITVCSKCHKNLEKGWK
jgi:5-methylcytosine-specific restriction endonuclease McrA